MGEAFHSVDGETCIKNGVEQPRSQMIYYNLWANNCFALDIGQYCGTDFVKITVLEGCEFPSYEYTNNNGAKKAFVQGVTVDYFDFFPNATSSTNWAPVRELGETAVSGVNFNSESKELSFTLSAFDLPESFGNRRESNLEAALNLYENVLVNGVSLEDIVADNEIAVQSYITGDTNGKGVFVLQLDGIAEINKVLIRKGAQFPAYNNTPVSVAEYSVFYYATGSDVMFVSENGNYVQSDEITWTVTFNGADPVEVPSGSKIPASAFPQAEVREGYRSVWMNGANEFDPDTAVSGNMNLNLEYIEVATITFDSKGGSSVNAITVDKGVIAGKPEDPVKEGYIFAGWFNGETEFDFTSPVNASVTLTAGWEKAAGGGCGSAMNITGSALLFTVVLTVAALAFAFKKQKANKNN